MEDWQWKGLLSCLPEIHAEEELRIRRTQGPLTVDRFKQLVYTATKDIEKAEIAGAQLWRELEKQKLKSPKMKVPTLPPV